LSMVRSARLKHQKQKNKTKIYFIPIFKTIIQKQFHNLVV
jgi:hypothetical protein